MNEWRPFSRHWVQGLAKVGTMLIVASSSGRVWGGIVDTVTELGVNVRSETTREFIPYERRMLSFTVMEPPEVVRLQMAPAKLNLGDPI